MTYENEEDRMTLYQTIHESVEARLFSGVATIAENEALALWCDGTFSYDSHPGQEQKTYYWAIWFTDAARNNVRAGPGSMILRDASGQFSVMSRSDFVAKFEPAAPADINWRGMYNVAVERASQFELLLREQEIPVRPALASLVYSEQDLAQAKTDARAEMLAKARQVRAIGETPEDKASDDDNSTYGASPLRALLQEDNWNAVIDWLESDQR